MLLKVLDRISFWSLFALVSFLPIFFIPIKTLSLEPSKNIFILITFSISLVSFLIARLIDGGIKLPKSNIYFFGFLVILSVFFSSIFSESIKVSLFGIMFDFQSFFFIFSLFLIMFMYSIYFRENDRVKIIFSGFLLSSMFVILFQVFHFIFPDIFDFYFLKNTTDNLIGSWNSFGVFSSLLAFVLIYIYEFFILPKYFKIILPIFIGISLFFLVLVNSKIIWFVFLFFVFLILIYKIFIFLNKNLYKKSNYVIGFPLISLITISIGLLFLIGGKSVTDFLINNLNLSLIEVYPSFKSTIDVSKSVILENPIFGAGSNRFSQMWDLYKPSIVNTTIFWESSFVSGSSFFFNFLITNGILGAISWIGFFIFYILYFLKYFFDSSVKYFKNMENNLLFFISLYLFVFSFLAPINGILICLLFIFLGIVIGISYSKKEDFSLSYLENSKKSILSILFTVVFVILIFSFSFKMVSRFVSFVYFEKVFTAQDISIGEKYINKALKIYKNDLYFRTYSQIYLFKLNSLLSKNLELSEDSKREVGIIFRNIIDSSESAVFFDNTNYLNLQNLGYIYLTLAPFGGESMYKNAIDIFTFASKLNPLNPNIKLLQARAYLGVGDIDNAKQNIQIALSLKSNYIDGLIFMSQILKNEGNKEDSIKYAQQAYLLDPNNKEISLYIDSISLPKIDDSNKNNKE